MIRAKMKCTKVDPQNDNEYVEFTAVIGVHGTVNGEWSKWTPSARFTMAISNPDAQDKFKLGGEYYVDFSDAAAADQERDATGPEVDVTALVDTDAPHFVGMDLGKENDPLLERAAAVFGEFLLVCSATPLPHLAELAKFFLVAVELSGVVLECVDQRLAALEASAAIGTVPSGH